MTNVFTDYSFINCERPYNELIRAAYEAPSAREREWLIACLIEYIEFVLFSGQYPCDDFAPVDAPDAVTIGSRNDLKCLPAAYAVRYCLHDPICQDRMWEWLVAVLPSLSPSARSFFAVTVFCPIVTPPIDWNDPNEMLSINRFLGLLDDPQRRWAVLEGFTEGSFNQAVAFLDDVNRWRATRGWEPLRVDYAELESYLDEFGVDEEIQALTREETIQAIEQCGTQSVRDVLLQTLETSPTSGPVKTTTISVDGLRQILLRVLERLAAVKNTELTIDKNYYWSIPASQRYYPYTIPDSPELNQLSHDWMRLSGLLQGQATFSNDALVSLSAVLLAIGEERAP